MVELSCNNDALRLASNSVLIFCIIMKIEFIFVICKECPINKGLNLFFFEINVH